MKPARSLDSLIPPAHIASGATLKLSEGIALYLSDACAGKTNGTPEAYKKKLGRFARDVGDKDLNAITRDDIERFGVSILNQPVKRNGGVTLKEHLSVWYVRGVLRTVKTFFRWLYEHGHISTNPAANLKIPKEPPKTPKAIDAEVFNKLLMSAARTGEPWERVRNMAFLCLLRDSGGRLSAILDAKYEDLALEVGFLTTTGKGGQIGTLFFNPPTAEALRAWLAYREQIYPRATNIFLCGSGKSKGKRITARGIYSMLRRLADDAQLPSGTRFNPHSFRHAFARDSIMLGGADLSEVSQEMWHSTIRVTADYYARYLPVELKRRHSITSPGARIKLPSIA